MANKQPPWFITFEGGEGAGKSTQIVRLKQRLEKAGVACLTTREPGGSAGAEEIRALLVSGETGRWSATSEALLNYAARDDHLRLVIRPALVEGITVICDRFMDSTRVYQGVAGDAAIDLIDKLEDAVVGTNRPDLTLILDIDPEAGLARARRRGVGVEDRYERKGLAFHSRLRQGFLDIAADEPQRCTVIDAEQEEDRVTDAIWRAVSSKLIG